MLVLLSYSPDWDQRCSRSCNCLISSGSGYFRISNHETEESLVDEVFSQVSNYYNKHRDYNHIVVRSFQDLVGINNDYSGESEDTSIQVPTIYNIYDHENWEELEKYNEEGYALQQRLRDLLQTKLKNRKKK